MTHPPAEKWMSYLYGELPAGSKAGLKEHLASCARCQKSVASWQAAMSGLNQWKLEAPGSGARSRALAPVTKWAIAALLVLGVGFGIGRLSAPGPSIEAIRAAIEPPLKTALAAEIKEQVQQELLADFQAALSGNPVDLRSDSRRELRLAANEWSARTIAQSAVETQRLLLDLAENFESNRQQDQATLLTLFDRAERQRQADYLSLRRAVETVAVVADDKFNRTESQLGQFASYVQARSLWDRADESVNP